MSSDVPTPSHHRARHPCIKPLIVVVSIMIGFSALFIIAVIVATIAEEDENQSTRASTSRPNPTRVPTRAPVATQPPSITAPELYAEREANATRFDQQRKGKWLRVSGIVTSIDNGVVSLASDEESFAVVGIAFATVDLKDLPNSRQVATNKGERFSATCKVGNYILGTIFMDDCK